MLQSQPVHEKKHPFRGLFNMLVLQVSYRKGCSFSLRVSGIKSGEQDISGNYKEIERESGDRLCIHLFFCACLFFCVNIWIIVTVGLTQVLLVFWWMFCSLQCAALCNVYDYLPGTGNLLYLHTWSTKQD